MDFKVHFTTLSFEQPFKLESGKCQMCLKEKVEILKNLKENGARSINRRWEVFRRCLHRGKFLLGTIDTRKSTQREHDQIGDRNSKETRRSEGSRGGSTSRDEGERIGEPLAAKEVGPAGEREDRGRGVLQNDQKILWGTTRSGRNWREVD